MQPRTWRRLTVAESLEVVQQDVAVAFRVRVGSDQWVIYRSLGERGNRTFFGENLLDEFFIGTLNRKGMVEAMVQIQ